MTEFARTVAYESTVNITFGTESTVNITFGQTQKLRFTVLLFGQVTKVFGVLYSVILQSGIQSSFFGHLD